MLANARKDHSSPFKVFQYMENHADISLIALQKPFPSSDRGSTPILFYLALDRTITTIRHAGPGHIQKAAN